MDGMVERVDGFRPELEPLPFGDEEVLVNAQIHFCKLRPAEIAHGAASECGSSCSHGGGRNVSGVKTLNETWGIGSRVWSDILISNVDRTRAARPFAKEVGA